jgi:signal transduction histidine kinase
VISRAAPILAIIASLIVVVLLDFEIYPPFVATVLYAVPIVIAARFCSVKVVVFTGLAVIVINALDLYSDHVPADLWTFSIIAIAITLALAVQVVSLREREHRRAQEAEAAREQLSEFMSLVVHDLRAPLTVALGYLQIAERQLPPANDQIRNSLAKVDQALRRTTHLVNDLLDSTRIGHGRFVVNQAPCDLTALARDVVEEQRLTDPHHHFFVDAPAQLIGSWDQVRLQQVLANLVSNAVKYSAPGTDIRVELRQQSDQVVLSVVDQGSGISPSDLGQIFQPFARPGHEREATGTGLGLYITKGIVEAHGGRIWVESRIGVGSTFYVELPLRSDSPPPEDRPTNFPDSTWT